jgi:hypothetical protein
VRRALALLLAVGCEAEAETVAVEPVAVETVAVEVATKTVDPEVVPAEPEAIKEWVQALAYRSWQAQSPVHATGEHGGARVFFNKKLAASMAAGASEHPIGAAGVRELYESDLATLRGFALMVKTGPSGQAGEGWYWFEMFGTTAETRPLVAEHGSRGCVGCHAAGVDFVHPPERP